MEKRSGLSLRSILAGKRALVLLGAPAIVALAAPANADEGYEPEQAAREVQQAADKVAEEARRVADSELPDPSAAADPRSPTERARDGVVTLERNGKALGFGTVLDGDGRILTALSPLTHGNNIDARFADGSVSNVRIGHVDRGWDLALLIPQNSRWKKGLKPSKQSPTAAGLSLRAFSKLDTKRTALSRTIVKGTRTLLGGDSALLRDALELASRMGNDELGSPILDDNGNVVAMVARACAPSTGDACDPVPYGVPISAVKAFLRTVPESAVPPAPWLGVQGVADEVGPVKGVRVLGVHGQSAAAAAGIRGGQDRSSGDVIVAVDGMPVITPEALADAINRRAVGDSVQLLLFGSGKFREVSLALRAAPGDSNGGPAGRPQK